MWEGVLFIMMISDAVLSSMTASQAAESFNTLSGCHLVTDEAHWASYGITTGLQLADYLDECVEKEKEDMACSMSHPYGEEPSVNPMPVNAGWFI